MLDISQTPFLNFCSTHATVKLNGIPFFLALDLAPFTKVLDLYLIGFFNAQSSSFRTPQFTF